MHAIGIHALGGPKTLQDIEIDSPEPNVGEVVIRIAAASVNRLDVEVRENGLPGGAQHFPVILGCDCSGVIASVGVLSFGFAVGDEVISAACSMTPGAGTYAEFVAVPSRLVARKPRGLNWAMAAAMPLAALAACQAVDRIMPEPGETILINGASGGVGSFAVQLLRMRGARVIANARNSAWQACLDLGAEACVDGRSQDLVPALRDIVPNGVDATLDLVDGATQVQCSEGMRRGSRLVTLLSVHERPTFKSRHVTAWNIDVKPNAAELGGLSQLIDAGLLVVPDVQVFELSDAPEAHERLGRGGVLGKLVLSVPSFAT